MSRSRILYAAAMLTAAAGVVVAAGPTSAASDPTPRVGQCRNLSAAASDAMMNKTAPIACSASHTARTVGMPKIPRSVDYRKITSRHFTELGVSLCLPSFSKALGGSHAQQDLTAYSFTFFAPTTAQRARGARWLRCDLVLRAGKALVPLPGGPRPVLRAPVTDAVRRCLTGDSWPLFTVCTSPHAYRSTAAFSMQVKSQKYPARKTFVNQGFRHCPTATELTWPSAVQWKGGDHAVVCYSSTTS